MPSTDHLAKVNAEHDRYRQRLLRDLWHTYSYADPGECPMIPTDIVANASAILRHGLMDCCNKN